MRKITSTIIGLAIAAILTAYVSALSMSNQAFAQPDKPGQTIGNNFFSQQPNGGSASNNQAQPEGQHADLGGASGAAGLFGQTPAGPEGNRYAPIGQVGPSPGVHYNAAITSPTHIPIYPYVVYVKGQLAWIRGVIEYYEAAPILVGHEAQLGKILGQQGFHAGGYCRDLGHACVPPH
jgi:hypothetical protein